VDVKKVSQSEVSKGKAGKTTITVETKVDGKQYRFSAEALLLATGRSPNSKEIGLKELHVRSREDGSIIIDDEMRSSIPNIYAAGDVTGEPMIEALAAREGTKAAENALTGSHTKIDLATVPRAIFTDPQFASVGLTEREAPDNDYECNCRVLSFSDLAKARIIGDARGVIKMVVDNKTLTVLGIHILCPNAADLIIILAH
jgi:mercuric reductase